MPTTPKMAVIFPVVVLLFLSAQNGLSHQIEASNYKSSSTIRFSNLYQDGMVLQREPDAATIWGYGSIQNDAEAVLECSLKGQKLSESTAHPYNVDEDIWQMELEPQNGGASCNITMTAGNEVLSLKDVSRSDIKG